MRGVEMERRGVMTTPSSPPTHPWYSHQTPLRPSHAPTTLRKKQNKEHTCTHTHTQSPPPRTHSPLLLQLQLRLQKELVKKNPSTSALTNLPSQANPKTTCSPKCAPPSPSTILPTSSSTSPLYRPKPSGKPLTPKSRPWSAGLWWIRCRWGGW